MIKFNTLNLSLKVLFSISNKSTNQMHQSVRFIVRRLNTAQHVSASSSPSSGAYKLQ